MTSPEAHLHDEPKIRICYCGPRCDVRQEGPGTLGHSAQGQSVTFG